MPREDVGHYTLEQVARADGVWFTQRCPESIQQFALEFERLVIEPLVAMGYSRREAFAIAAANQNVNLYEELTNITQALEDE